MNNDHLNAEMIRLIRSAPVAEYFDIVAQPSHARPGVIIEKAICKLCGKGYKLYRIGDVGTLTRHLRIEHLTADGDVEPVPVQHPVPGGGAAPAA